MFFSWARMRFHRLRSFPTSWMTQWGHLGRRIRCRSRYAGIALTILYTRASRYIIRALHAVIFCNCASGRDSTATRAIPEQERRSQLDSTYRQRPGTAAFKRETRSRCL